MNNKMIIRFLVIILFFLVWILNLFYNIRYAHIVYHVNIYINGLDGTNLESIKFFREGLRSGLSEIDLAFNKNSKRLNWEIRNYYIKKIFIIIPYSIFNKKYNLYINIGNKKFVYTNKDILSFRKAKNKKIKKFEKENEIFEIPAIVSSEGFNLYFLSGIINTKKIFEILFFSFFESIPFYIILLFLFYLSFNKVFIFKENY